MAMTAIILFELVRQTIIKTIKINGVIFPCAEHFDPLKPIYMRRECITYKKISLLKIFQWYKHYWKTLFQKVLKSSIL